ncbi:hypothetical protein BRC70_04685 [Halobacteriales archaeon QH_6_68_27]|nr:MAG: hypothetical protein BRC70_04685 [Halobacteriales archaeon QH_6_68_27]
MTEDTAESETNAPAGSDPSAADDARPRVEAALTEVRRECWKAATLHAVVEATAVFFAANLVLVTVDPGWLPTRFVLPEAVGGLLAGALGVSGPVGLPGSGTLAFVLGLVAFAVGIGYRVRRPLVEQFEAANPEVREALRTARDAVESEGQPQEGPRSERQGPEPADSLMARRLYADVLDGLDRSSGLALVDQRRLGVGVAAVVLLSVLTVQVAVLDLNLFDADEEITDDGSAPVNNYTGLLDGDQVLGDSEAVEAGEEELNASVESSGGGQDVGDEQQFPSDGAPGAGAPSNGVEGQQAGFAAPERVEDAELVREYNRRIRSEDGAGGSDDGGDSEQDVDGDNS